MIANQKEYLIKIFLNKCNLRGINKGPLDLKFKWCEDTFNVSPEKVKEIKEKYTLNELMIRTIPLIEKQFSAEEIKELIAFYSTNAGKKLLDPLFLKELGRTTAEMYNQIEKEFYSNDKGDRNA